MKTKRLLIFALVILVASCKPSDEKMRLKMNRKIAKAEEKIEKFENKIAGYQQQLEILATSDTAVRKSSTVITTLSPKREDFRKYIDIQGAVTSKNNVLVSSNSGGVIMSILVTEGQQVGVGQTLAVINSDVLQSSIKEVESALDLANAVYERQKRLWEDQKIGTEMQYLQAKNQVENLEKKLGTLQTQLDDATVRSLINGVVDEVYAVRGELVGPGSPIARVVNLSQVQVEAEIPESFLGTFKKGDKVEVEFPSLGIVRSATIKAIGQVINPGNRTFKVEVDLPNADLALKPNLLANLKLKQYESSGRLIIPTKIIQDGSKGNYVFTIESDSVVKKWIEVGQSYNGQSEVLEGLTEEDTLIFLGFKDVVEGENVRVEKE